MSEGFSFTQSAEKTLKPATETVSTVAPKKTKKVRSKQPIKRDSKVMIYITAEEKEQLTALRGAAAESAWLYEKFKEFIREAR